MPHLRDMAQIPSRWRGLTHPRRDITGYKQRKRRAFRDSAQVARRLLSPRCSLERSHVDVTLQYTEGARFVAEARHHRLVLDQPAQDGATDRGMTPSELLLSALGGCVGQYVAQYLILRGLSTEGLLVRVEARPSARPLRMKDFEVEVVVPGLTEPQLRALQKSFPAGLVQNAIALENSLRVSAVSMRSGDIDL